ncbi:hypothetical protein M422DRAFT_111693, partial [Sphaerobolus stellatus SS14]
IFEGMLSLPPTPDVEMYDGIPLVHLQDTSDHLEDFLSFSLFYRKLPFEKLRLDTVSRVEGLLLFATKYQVDSLRKRIISHLEKDWPSTLEQWDKNEEDNLLKEDEFYKRYPDPASCIRLARMCDVPSLLLAAYYDLSRIPIHHD